MSSSLERAWPGIVIIVLAVVPTLGQTAPESDDNRLQVVHRWLGVVTAAASLGALVMLARASRAAAAPHPRTAFRVALLVSTLLVCATGFFGGALVFGLDHYAWR
ncbi:MAG: hypothetical protein R3B57_03605 [Phycisphaerales bacterium]